ncbi:hypothetical protein PIB30_061407 [Stylosanthes scabra]|uniref:Uncharacterized protein n=1 Tax=Stylosanthes scabra TaxID=79078 RepID=A0ABU6UPG7_9FABA|nr:hypothetical protein [Stylosanthes scabra]
MEEHVSASISASFILPLSRRASYSPPTSPDRVGHLGFERRSTLDLPCHYYRSRPFIGRRSVHCDFSAELVPVPWAVDEMTRLRLVWS